MKFVILICEMGLLLTSQDYYEILMLYYVETNLEFDRTLVGKIEIHRTVVFVFVSVRR